MYLFDIYCNYVQVVLFFPLYKWLIKTCRVSSKCPNFIQTQRVTLSLLCIEAFHLVIRMPLFCSQMACRIKSSSFQETLFTCQTNNINLACDCTYYCWVSFKTSRNLIIKIHLLDSLRRSGPCLEGEQEYELSMRLLSSWEAWGKRGWNFFPVVFLLLRLLLLLLLKSVTLNKTTVNGYHKS